MCVVLHFFLFCFMERAHGWDLITMLLPNFASSSYSYSPPRRSRAEASSVASAGPTFSLAASTPLPLDGFSKSVSFSPLLLPAASALPFLCTITVPFPGETTREAGGREGADPSAPRGSGLELGSSGRLSLLELLLRLGEEGDPQPPALVGSAVGGVLEDVVRAELHNPVRRRDGALNGDVAVLGHRHGILVNDDTAGEEILLELLEDAEEDGLWKRAPLLLDRLERGGNPGLQGGNEPLPRLGGLLDLLGPHRGRPLELGKSGLERNFGLLHRHRGLVPGFEFHLQARKAFLEGSFLLAFRTPHAPGPLRREGRADREPDNCSHRHLL
mmetsp:Transcript_5004/g.15177  ORF Transcript_5004/g.15177 Transcript_5004/m.15177 type:complete len:329 (-) Transcript_5004:17-1003(-)